MKILLTFLLFFYIFNINVVRAYSNHTLDQELNSFLSEIDIYICLTNGDNLYNNDLNDLFKDLNYNLLLN